MNGQQRQSHALLKLFLHRMIDPEVIAAGSETHQTLVNALALLAAGAIVITLMMGGRAVFLAPVLSPAHRAMLMWSDQLFLILVTMAVSGFFASLAWDAIFPDVRDAFILGALPLQPMALVRSRIFALLLWGTLLFLAMQLPPGLLFPALWNRGSFGALILGYAAQWTTLAMASWLVFATAIAAQGVLLLSLPQKWFLRISAVAQVGCLLLSFSILFLTPDVAAARRLPEWIIHALPPYWLLSLWQHVAGQPQTLTADLSAPALAAFAVTTAAAVLLLAAGFRVSMRRSVEGYLAQRTGRAWWLRGMEWMVDRTLLRDTGERAVFWFAARTLLRHRGHRLLLGVAFGVGLGYVLSGLSSAAYGHENWSKPTAMLCAIPLELLFFLLTGMRALFSLPVDLRANWMFRLSDAEPASMMRGAEKLFWVFALMPVGLGLLPFYAAMWPMGTALRHTVYAMGIGWFFSEMLLKKLRKVPFTCSWQPGDGDLRVKFGLWFVLFAAITYVLADAEAIGLNHHDGTWWFVPSVLAVWALIARAARNQELRDTHELTFEDLPPLQVRTLGLTS